MLPFTNAALMCGLAGAAVVLTPPSFVGGKSVGIPGRTSGLTISLTDLTGGLDTQPSAGDVVIVAYVVSTTGQKQIGTTTAGYRRLAMARGDDTCDTNMEIEWKVMGVSPDTSVDVTQTFGSAEGGAVAIHVWRGVSPIQPFEVGAAALGNNTGRPDPSSTTPSTSGWHP